MRSTLAAIAALALSGFVATAVAESPDHESTYRQRCAAHPHPSSEHRRLTRRTFALTHWRNPAPGPGAVKTMERLRSCVRDERKRAKLRAEWKAAKARLKAYARYRRVAPYAGFSGEGLYLTYLAVPKAVVACETRGYSGEGRWTATNPDGDAQGPAQLKAEHGAPRPAMTPSERIEYWEVAAGVLADSGLSAWGCA